MITLAAPALAALLCGAVLGGWALRHLHAVLVPAVTLRLVRWTCRHPTVQVDDVYCPRCAARLPPPNPTEPVINGGALIVYGGTDGLTD